MHRILIHIKRLYNKYLLTRLVEKSVLSREQRFLILSLNKNNFKLIIII